MCIRDRRGDGQGEVTLHGVGRRVKAELDGDGVGAGGTPGQLPDADRLARGDDGAIDRHLRPQIERGALVIAVAQARPDLEVANLGERMPESPGHRLPRADWPPRVALRSGER